MPIPRSLIAQVITGLFGAYLAGTTWNYAKRKACIARGYPFLSHALALCEDNTKTVNQRVRYASKRDIFHGQIAQELRDAGFSVADTSLVGAGSPDLAIARNNVCALVVIKTPKGLKTALQRRSAGQMNSGRWIGKDVRHLPRLSNRPDFPICW